MIRDMKEAFPDATIIGSDVLKSALERLAAQMPTVPLLRFDLVACPLPDACVDATVLLNVLEHIEDDTAALHQVRRILRPGGIAVIEVPAGPHLFDAYDQALHHFRRYRIHELSRTLEACGFDVLRKSHLGCFIYPAFAAVKRRNQRISGPAPDLRSVVSTQARSTAHNPLLAGVIGLEVQLGRWLQVPGRDSVSAAGTKAWLSRLSHPHPPKLGRGYTGIGRSSSLECSER